MCPIFSLGFLGFFSLSVYICMKSGSGKRGSRLVGLPEKICLHLRHWGHGKRKRDLRPPHSVWKMPAPKSVLV